MIFVGPPLFDDCVSHLKECQASSRVAIFSEAVARSLRKAGVLTLDAFSMKKSLAWAGGLRYELCSYRQTPAM